MDPTQLLLISGTLAVMLVGLAGTVLPALPGIELIWLAAVAYGVVAWFASGFSWWGVLMLILITILLIVGEALTFVVAQTAAVKTGASWQAVIASIVLGLIGMFIIPIVGALLGAMLGVFLVEYYRRRKWKEALRATTGTLWGYGLAIGAQFVIGVVMMGIWGLWVLVEVLSQPAAG